MIDLISIHIPKTAGRSFYNILEQVYGSKLSISYKRQDLTKALENHSSLAASIAEKISVIHGHLYYRELGQIHKTTNARLICWLRDPVDRVVSNYHFFIRGLQNPSRNPAGYAVNKHRINETLIEYASKEGTRNRMSKFLDGIHIDDLFFIGLQEHFEEDVLRLGKMLDWPDVVISMINKNPDKENKKPISFQIRQKIETLNALDYELFHRVIENKR